MQAQRAADTHMRKYRGHGMWIMRDNLVVERRDGTPEIQLELPLDEPPF
jgi:hypothetical protein